MRRSRSPYSSGFEHGDKVVIGGFDGRPQYAIVHAPQWWNAWGHFVWLVALARKRTARMTLGAGEVLRLRVLP